MTLDELVGKEVAFHGVDGNFFRVDDHVFEAVEDESDGYRSCLREIREVVPERQIFFQTPLETVLVQVAESSDMGTYGVGEGFKLVGKDGHIWLKVGTANTDDYYPWFVFEYRPRAAP